MTIKFFGALAAICLAIHADNAVAIQVFNINADGAAEVTAGGTPNQGDLDGSAIGTLTLNEGTGVGTTGSALFNITLANLDLATLSGHHIHQAPATTTGSIVLDFGDPDVIRTGSVLSGTVTSLPAAIILGIFANPTGFYYNLHNVPFPGGAVRDQLVPEPSALLLLTLGVSGLLTRRRR